MKKFMILILTLVLVGTMAFAQSGTYGANLTWILKDSTLTISGTGKMNDYTSNNNVTWHSYGYKNVIIEEGVTSIGESAFMACHSLTSIEIPNSVTSIGDFAFISCWSLTSIEIPSSVTSIGDEVFSYCSSLNSIDVKNENKYYSSENGVLFNKDKTTLILCPEGKAGSYTIPNSVTSIEDWAFSNCRYLTSIEISSSVTSIGEYAFIYCDALTSIIIPSSVTSIGKYPFSYYCPSLTSVINYSNTPQNILKDTSMRNCTLYVPAESVTLYKQAEGWKEFTILPILQGAIVTDVSDIEIPAGKGIIVITARVAWNAVENAVGYTLVIKDSAGETICTLEFDAMGRLVGITLKSQDVFGVRITNLSENTTYNYTMKAIGANSAVLSTKTGTFTTTGGGVGIAETLQATSLQVYPNPTTGRFQLTINNEQLTMNNRSVAELDEANVVEIYDNAGHLVGVEYFRPSQSTHDTWVEYFRPSQSTHDTRVENINFVEGFAVRPLQHGNGTTIDISHLPNGIYFIQINGKRAKVVKQ